jgi:ubiquitin thioesterase protein OTUB1
LRWHQGAYFILQFLYDESMPNRPLIDEIVPMSQLREEYEKGSPSFVQQIDWLQNQGYKALRRTKGPSYFLRFFISAKN